MKRFPDWLKKDVDDQRKEQVKNVFKGQLDLERFILNRRLDEYASKT